MRKRISNVASLRFWSTELEYNSDVDTDFSILSTQTKLVKDVAQAYAVLVVPCMW